MPGEHWRSWPLNNPFDRRMAEDSRMTLPPSKAEFERQFATASRRGGALNRLQSPCVMTRFGA
jgi:hypothetical protein